VGAKKAVLQPGEQVELKVEARALVLFAQALDLLGKAAFGLG